MKKLILIFLFSLIITPLFSQEDRSIRQIFAVDASQLDEKTFLIFDPYSNFLHIKITNDFGYSSHLVVGEVLIKGEKIIVGMVQKNSYDSITKVSSVSRELIETLDSWQELIEMFSEDKLKKFTNDFWETRKGIVGGIEISLTFRNNSSEIKITKWNPSKEIQGFVADIERICDVKLYYNRAPPHSNNSQ